MRLRRRAVLLALGALLLSLAAGWFPQQPLRRLAETRMSAALAPLGGTARIGSLHVIPGLLRLDVGGLVVETRDLRLSLDHGSLALAPAALVGQLVVRSVRLSSPRLEILGHGAASGVSGGSAVPVPPFRVERLLVENGSLRDRTPDLGGDLTLRGISIQGGIAPGTLQVEVAGGGWARPRPLRLRRATARLTTSSLWALSLPLMEVETIGSRLQASGRLGRLNRLRPELRWSGTLDLAEVAGLLDLPPASGRLRLSGQLSRSAELQVRARLEGEGLEAGGWPVPRATGEVRLDGSRIDGSLDLTALGGRLGASARGTLDALHARLRAEGLALGPLVRRLAPGGPRVEGTLAAEASLDGDPRAALDSALSLTLSGLSGGTRLDLHGHAEGPLRLAATPNLDLSWTADLAAASDEPTPPSRLRRAALAASGTLRGAFPPAAEADFGGDLTLVGPGGPAPLTLDGKAQAAAGTTSLRLEARGEAGHATASLVARNERVSRLDVEAGGLALNLLEPKLAGTLSLTIHGSGPVTGLGLEAEARAEGLSYGGVQVGAGRLHLRREPGGRIAFDAGLTGLGLTAEGSLSAGVSPRLAAKLTLVDTPLETIGPLLPAKHPVSGRLSGTVEAELPLRQPRAASVAARLTAATLASGPVSVHATGPFEVRLDKQRLFVAGLELEGPGSSLAVDGEAGLDPGATLGLELRGNLDLAELTPPSGWSLAGRARIDTSIGGSVGRPEAKGQVDLRDVSVSHQVTRIRIPEGRIVLDGEALELPGLTALLDGGSVSLRGRLPLSAAWTAARRSPESLGPGEGMSLHLAWTGLDAGGLLAAARPGARGVEATLEGEAEIEGGLASLRELTVRARVPATSATVRDLGLELSPFELDLDAGEARTPGIAVTAEGGTFRLAGSIDLARRALDLRGTGRLRLRSLSPLLTETSLSGIADADLTVTGSLDSPDARGSVAVQQATLRARSLPQALTEIRGRIVFDGEALRLEDTSAVLGGGTLALAGGARLHGTGLDDVSLEITGRELALRYPEGLRSRIDADLTLTGKTGALQLGGEVRAVRGLYDLDVALSPSALAPAAPPTRSALLRSVGLDLRIVTQNPVTVRNNLADLQATGAFTIRGDMETPAPYGRLEIEPGGKLFLQDRSFRIEEGRFTYAGSWEPEIALTASTVVEDQDAHLSYQITVSAQGSLQQPHLGFSSSPPLSEREAVSLLVTGRTSAQALQSTAWVAGEQAAALLTGRLSRSLSRELQQLGLDQVTIQPELLARETTPGARFTFGKRIGEDLSLLYSLSLTEPENRFVQVEAQPGYDLDLFVQRRDDGTLTYGGGQRLRFGGVRAERRGFRRSGVRIGELSFEGDLPFPEEKLRETLKTQVGDRASAWSLQSDADRLRDWLRDRGYLEAEVGSRLQGTTAVFVVRPGPEFDWQVEGMADPPDLTDAVRGALYEEEALDRGQARLLEVLRRRGHLEARVETAGRSQGGRRDLVFRVEPGPRVRLAGVAFPGAEALSRGRLLRAAGGPATLLTEPDRAVAGIRQAYESRNYLGATVDPPRAFRSPQGLRIVVPVHEGGPATVASLRFEGASRPAAELGRVASVEVGAPYREDRAIRAALRIRDDYLSRGYPGIRVAPTVERQGTDVVLVFHVIEGPHVVVGDVEVVGNRHVRDSLIRRELPFGPGDPLDPRQLASAERRLLALGIFSRASVTAGEGSPSTVTARVQESPRLVLSYNARYNDTQGATGEVDGELRDLFGRGLTVGARYRKGPDVDELRGSLQVPSFLGIGGLTASVFRLEEQLPALTGESQGPINTRLQRGFQIQQNVPLPDRWTLLYGYRFKRSTLTSEVLLFPITENVAALEASLLRDTRDRALDARRGRFLSLNLELAPKALASDFTFVKGLAQAFVSRSLGPTLTWAQGYRLGLAAGFGGQSLVSSERFTAGGANSVRGFGEGSLGPVDPFLMEPTGGNAVLVLNQELRYMSSMGLGAAVFYDAGNVFAKVSDLSLDLRHAAGIGLRWDSPLGLLRLDLGFPLDRKPGEKSVRLFFNLGQAF